MNYDLAVIGAGPGGYVAALRAVQLGAKTLLIEKDTAGGTCLNRGCIPTKALVASAARWQDLRRCAEFGLKADNIGFDFAAVLARKDAVVRQLNSGVAALIRGGGVEYLKGAAVLRGDKRIFVQTTDGGQEITAEKIIIAAGSSPARPPIEGLDLPGVLDSDRLLAIERLPRNLTIIGGGVIGLEFAGIFQSFGCQVTVVEMLPAILERMDKDIIIRLGPPLRKQGIKFLTASRVRKITRQGDNLAVAVENAKGIQEIAAELVLVAAGRVPRLTGLGLEAAGVAFDRRGITVDESMRTSAPDIYAVGDVTGRSFLAHAASAAGLVAAGNACGQNDRMDFSQIPACVFTTPEVASVGLTEQETIDRAVAISKFNFAGNGKAVASGENDGFVKIIADKDSHRVLGVHILGPHASDLIMEGALAVRHGLTAEAVARTVHPHPTLSEVMAECAHGIFGEPIHQMKSKVLGGR
jgi:dihydrolipoamide dehydrogenase